MTREQSKTLVIILHEIYGVNNHIHHYEKLLSMLGYEVLCPNLLHRDPFPYEREDEAYDYFMQSISFEKAAQEVSQLVEDYRSRYERIFLVGFSVGTTVAWMCSGEAEVDGVVGFYGSRIRSYVGVEPRCQVQLIFSSQEKSLNVEELATGLSEKRGTGIQIVEGRHGFMNPFHPAYDAIKAGVCMEQVLELLRGNDVELIK
ncbi:Carboxymethylenebutenolidase [compost metagenome]